jgi:RimJ/RimL family protein N-acetyltransferase
VGGGGGDERSALALPWPPLVDDVTSITLRPWGAGAHDAAALAAAWADPEVQRWNAVPVDRSEHAARVWIHGEERRRAEGLAIDLVIAATDQPQEVLGEVGLVMVAPARGWAELGWWLTPPARGAGRAASAARLFADWAMTEVPVHRLVARTHPDNPRAARVAAAAGMTHSGALESGTMVWVRNR